ncbi:hypothetical protein [Ignavigranum ruoffiae]|uniref:hypothetical protein n=1 Tax=Ignavigranum ruoffiae TaxID=89093 RepID=UPI0023579988|nr:hypothetical protein [Ignavigranum ruoffiae]
MYGEVLSLVHLTTPSVSETIIKQGDTSELSFKLVSSEKDKSFATQSGTVYLSRGNALAFQKSIRVSADNVVNFSIDKVLPSGRYKIEVVIGNKYKFPSNSDGNKITITKSAENLTEEILSTYNIDNIIAKVISQVGTVDGGNIDTSLFALKSELANYVKSADLNGYARSTDLTGYAKTSDLTGYAKTSDLANYVKTSTLSNYALTTALANYATKEHTHDEYALKDHTHENYVTQEELAQASLGGEVDLSGYVSKAELEDKGYLTSIPDEYVTETELSEKGYLTVETFTQTQADELYQPIGDYATKEDLASISTGGSIDLSDYVKTSDLDNYASKDDLQGYLSNEALEQMLQSKGYLTTIPDEYITESELEQKGYLRVIESTEQPQETGVLWINPDGTVDIGEAYDDSRVWEEIGVLKANTSSMASKTYVDGKLGDIETALSTILGGA